MRKMRFVIMTLLLLVIGSFGFSQGVIKGKIVIDNVMNPLPGATVVVENTIVGTTTNLDGSFVLDVPDNGDQKVKLTYVGFTDQFIEVTIEEGKTLDLGEIVMIPSSVGLSEVEILASIAIDRKTPVAVSTINNKLIETELGSQELPEIMKFSNNNEVYVKDPKNEIKQIVVYDISGRKVYDVPKFYKETTFNLGNGVFIINILTTKGKQVKKIII